MQEALHNLRADEEGSTPLVPLQAQALQLCQGDHSLASPQVTALPQNGKSSERAGSSRKILRGVGSGSARGKNGEQTEEDRGGVGEQEKKLVTARKWATTSHTATGLLKTCPSALSKPGSHKFRQVTTARRYIGLCGMHKAWHDKRAYKAFTSPALPSKCLGNV